MQNVSKIENSQKIIKILILYCKYFPLKKDSGKILQKTDMMHLLRKLKVIITRCIYSRYLCCSL